MNNDCTPKCGEQNPPISAASVIYKGNLLTCIGAEIPETLEVLIHKLDKAICDKLQDIGSLNQLENVGGGIELYVGDSNTGKKQIATLRSPDDSVSITYNNETREVNIEVDIPQIQNFIFGSEDGTVDITRNEEGNEVDFSFEFVQEFLTLESETITITDGSEPNSKKLEVNFPPQEFLTLESETITITDGSEPNSKKLEVNFPPQGGIGLESADNSVSITEGTASNKRDLSVDFSKGPTQVRSNVIESDPGSLAFIQNQNPTKEIFANYTLVPSDNNYTIIVDTALRDITISAPSTLPTNFFVGMIQKGTRLVTIEGYDTKPFNSNNEMRGEGHTAAIEVVSLTSGAKQIFLLGSLKRTS
jgi:hypothetical protein